jgi:MinD superfamily P-loop ATPase
MNIAIASGKGGTGKTTIAVNLAWVVSQQGENVCYLDCDVEEPNGSLFLKPSINKKESATIPVPLIDESKCTGCGECVNMCQYRALVRLGKTVMVFDELCHGCGGCTLACPQKAITEKEKNIGIVEIGTSGKIKFVHGRLNIGEAMSPPLIRKVLKHATNNTALNIIDAPPGTSCPVITSIRKADFVILVTEPTPFGLNDLALAVNVVRELDLPHAVVINRSDVSTAIAKDFCKSRNISILAEIPDNRKIAEAYSEGKITCEVLPEYKQTYINLYLQIRKKIIV